LNNCVRLSKRTVAMHRRTRRTLTCLIMPRRNNPPALGWLLKVSYGLIRQTMKSRRSLSQGRSKLLRKARTTRVIAGVSSCGGRIQPAGPKTGLCHARFSRVTALMFDAFFSTVVFRQGARPSHNLSRFSPCQDESQGRRVDGLVRRCLRLTRQHNRTCQRRGRDPSDTALCRSRLQHARDIGGMAAVSCAARCRQLALGSGGFHGFCGGTGWTLRRRKWRHSLSRPVFDRQDNSAFRGRFRLGRRRSRLH
jgi:hypothetical protein